MTDDGKRSEMICTKVTERMTVDLHRLLATEDRTVSEFLFLLIRRELYGRAHQRDSDPR